MQWFRHMTNAADSDDLSFVYDKFGHKGYAMWFMILELVAKEMDYVSAKCHRSLSVNDWCSFLKVKPKILFSFLEHSKNILGMKTEQNGNILRIEIPKLVVLRDDEKPITELVSLGKDELKKNNVNTSTDKIRIDIDKKEIRKDKKINQKKEIEIENHNLASETSSLAVAEADKTKDCINEILGHFKLLDETYQKYFPMKTQRDAVKAMVKSVGQDKLILVIEEFSKIKHQEYAPRVNSPIELFKNWGKVTTYLDRDKIDKTIGHKNMRNMIVGNSWLEKKKAEQAKLKQEEETINAEFRNI